MKIIDLDGNKIVVADLALALLHADDYRHYRVTKPTSIQLHLYDYWEDFFQKLLNLHMQMNDDRPC